MIDNENDQQSTELEGSTEESGCPPGTVWDPVNKVCVPIIIDEEED